MDFTRGMTIAEINKLRMMLMWMSDKWGMTREEVISALVDDQEVERNLETVRRLYNQEIDDLITSLR